MLISSCTVTTIAVDGDNKKKPRPRKPKKRKSRSSSVLKRAIFVARKQSKTAPPKSGDQKGFWKTMICSMRPRPHQLEHGQDEPPTSVIRVLPPAPTKDKVDCFESQCSPLKSSTPEHSLLDSVCSSSSIEDFRDLENSGGGSTCTTTPPSDEEIETNEIDLRAEEFIQKFYEQIRLQSLESAVWLYS